jgi:hypothetical protein
VVGRKSLHGGVTALGSDRIQFDFEFAGVRYCPTLKCSPTEANLKRTRKQLQEIRQRIAAGTFVFPEEFPVVARTGVPTSICSFFCCLLLTGKQMLWGLLRESVVLFAARS